MRFGAQRSGSDQIKPSIVDTEANGDVAPGATCAGPRDEGNYHA